MSKYFYAKLDTFISLNRIDSDDYVLRDNEVEISEKTYEDLISEMNNGKPILILENNVLIAISEDDDRVPEPIKIQILNNRKLQADELIEQYAKYTMPFYYKKLTEQQQIDLDNYLNELDGYVNNGTITAEFPVLPDSIKDL